MENRSGSDQRSTGIVSESTAKALPLSKTGSEGSMLPGNTKLVAKRGSSSKKWCFTWFNEIISLGSIINMFEEGDKVIVGEEHCPTTQRVHYQGYVQFKIKCRPIEKMAQKMPGAHWEKARGSEEQNIIYCSKENKYVVIGFIVPKKKIDPLDGLILHKWQKKILTMISERCIDTRKIYWYWSEKGSIGKTALAKHICMHHNAIYVQGKANDIKSAIATWLKEKKELDIAIFAFPRTVEDYVSYDALESVKDGIFFNGKYESGMCTFNSPHVIVFANFEPDKSKLSADRWVIKRLDKPIIQQTILEEYV